MSWDDVFGERSVRSVESPLESARFGRTVNRLNVGTGAGEPFSQVREAVVESAADVVVLRYPAEHVGWFARLAGLGRTAVFADSLVYWRLRAGTGRAPEPSPHLRVTGRADPEVVRALVAATFAAYGSHYLANPLFDPAAALAGYQEWALRSAAGGGCLVLEHRDTVGEGAGSTEADACGGPPGDEPRAAGLATLEEGRARTEILLAGVVSGLQGRGLYPHLLKAVEDRTLARGAAEVVISTQGHNTRVQRAWARYGFEPVQTLLTVHLVRSPLPREHDPAPLPLAREH